MLLLLAEWLEQYYRAFNVFSYITLRDSANNSTHIF